MRPKIAPSNSTVSLHDIPRASPSPSQFPETLRLTINHIRDLARLLGTQNNVLIAALGSSIAFAGKADRPVSSRALEIHCRLIARNPRWLRVPEHDVIELVAQVAKFAANHRWVAAIRTANGKLLIEQPKAVTRLVYLMLGRHVTTAARMTGWRSTGNLDSLAHGLIWNFSRCSNDDERQTFVNDWVEAFRDQLIAENLDIFALLRGRKEATSSSTDQDLTAAAPAVDPEPTARKRARKARTAKSA